MDIICAGYIRVSKVDKDESGKFENIESPDTQRDSFFNFLKTENKKHPQQTWILPKEFIFEDIDTSGYSISYKKRKGLQQIFNLASTGQISKVLLYRFNRLSRRYKDQIDIIDKLESCGVEVISATEYIDGKTATGKLQRGILGIVSQYHSDQLSEVISDVQVTMTKKGRRIGGPANWGYKFVKDNKDIKKMIPDKKLKEHVELIFNLVLKNWGSAKIATYLNQKAIPAPSGIYWWYVTVLEIVRNPVYKGYVRYGYRSNRNKKKRNRDCLIIKSPYIEPIISEEKWDLAQKILDKRITNKRRNSSSSYLLTGIAKCALCDSTIHGYSDGRKEPYKYRGYACSKRGIPCKSGRISTKIIDSVVKKAVYDEFISQPERITNYVNRVNAAVKMSTLEFKKRLQYLENRKNLNIKKFKEWSNMRVSGEITPEEYGIFHEELQKERKQLDEEERELRNLQKPNQEKMVDEQVIRNILSNFSDVMNNRDIEEQKLFIQCFVKEVEFPIIKDEKRFLKINFRFKPENRDSPLLLEFNRVRRTSCKTR